MEQDSCTHEPSIDLVDPSGIILSTIYIATILSLSSQRIMIVSAVPLGTMLKNSLTKECSAQGRKKPALLGTKLVPGENCLQVVGAWQLPSPGQTLESFTELVHVLCKLRKQGKLKNQVGEVQ